MAAAMPSGAAYAPPSYLRRHLLSMDAPYPIDSYESLCRGVSGSEFTFDLGNLAAFDPSPLNEEEARTNPDGCCQQLATTMTQALVERLFALPSQPVEGGRIAQLPPPSTPLPRAKPLPKPRAPTKWERFAQRKGIQKQKRSKLVLDEASGEWKRRYGYKHANDPDNVPIMEASSGDQGGEDPFTQQQAAKQKGIKAQGKRQLANLKAQAKAEGRTGPRGSSGGAAVPVQDYAARRQQQTAERKQASRQAGVSTASMGKYDKRLPDEKPDERAPSSKRRKFAPVTEAGGAEGQRVSALVDNILARRGTELVDLDQAVGRHEADGRKQQRLQQQGQASASKAERSGARKGGVKKGGRPKGGSGRPEGKAGGRPTGKAAGRPGGKGASKAGPKGKRR